MNFSAYDPVNTIDNSYILPEYYRLYTKSIKYRNYYTFLKRYDEENKTYNYFLCMCDAPTNTLEWYSANRDTKGLIKISLKPIWLLSQFRTLTTRTPVNLVLDTQDDDGEIYYIKM